MIKRSPTTAGKASKIFVSYRRTDSPGHAGRLSADLTRHFGADQVFMDTTGIDGGEDFVRVIEGRITSCRVLLAIIGGGWLNLLYDTTGSSANTTDWVSLEIAAALEKRILVIPVLVGHGQIPPGESLPEELKSLARLQAVTIRDDRWDLDVAQLIRILERAVYPKEKRIELALLLVSAVALIAILLLVYHLLTVPMPAKPDADGRFNLPPVVMGTHEVIIEGPEINAEAGLLLSHVGGPAEEITFEAEKAQLSQETIDDLELRPRPASTFGKVTYASAGAEDTVVSKRSCDTSLELKLVNRKLPDAISFSQAPILHEGGDRDYRDLKMKSSGADLFFSLSTNPQSGPVDENGTGDEDGPGCVKHLIVNPLPDHLHFGGYAVDGVVAANSDIQFRFTPPTNGKLWEGAEGPFVFGSTQLKPEDPPTGLRAQAVHIKSLKGATSFEIRSVDQANLLRIDSLAVEPNRLRVGVSGEAAFVTLNGHDGVGARERFQRFWLWGTLLAVVMVALIIFLAALVLRLLRR